MKIKFIFILITIFFVSMTCSKATKEDEREWKGKVENEGEVRIVKNPAEPFYGEIYLDLEEELSIGNENDENYMFNGVTDVAADSQGNIYVLDRGNFRVQKFDHNGQYLQTIGKKGQGPGEFERPARLFLDSQENMYVTDGGRRIEGRMIKIFDNRGKFVRVMRLDSPISDFHVDSEGNILANIAQNVERGTIKAVVKMNSEGKLIKKIAEFSDVKQVIKRNSDRTASFRVSHHYTPRLSFSPINEQTFLYAYSAEYKVFVIDKDGKLVMQIQKEETPNSISRREKERIIEMLEESISRSGPKWPKDVLEEACDFPPTRPFFMWAIADDMKRLFLWRVKSVLDESEEREYDLFNKEGYFIYRAKIPVRPEIINKGFLYDIKEDDETGEVFIRRFRINNWDQIKEGI
ncbi:MAG: 6-bladed beta-propeller [Candidatus Aminicenantes bacterium]|nr:6-bladed beta-propeller [Candidatus Aminicenantes bacterium]